MYILSGVSDYRTQFYFRSSMVPENISMSAKGQKKDRFVLQYHLHGYFPRLPKKPLICKNHSIDI